MRLLRRALYLLIASAVLLELVLQVGALAVWLLADTPVVVVPADREEAARRVLCLGDSFTYGLGASDPATGSYPAHLQDILDEQEPKQWRIFNQGWPGRNSRGLLERLGEQLTRLRPQVVCIFIGNNDRWSWPEELPADFAQVAGEGLRFEYRTARLVKLLLDRLREEPVLEDSSPGAAWGELLRGRMDRAGAGFRRGISEGDVASQLGLMELARFAGDAAAMADCLAQMRRLYLERRDAESGGVLLSGLLLADKLGEAREIDQQLGDGEPEDWRLANARAWLAFLDGDRAAASAAIRTASRIVPALPEVYRLELLRRSVVFAETSLEDFRELRAAIADYRRDADEAALRRVMAAGPDSPELLYEVLWDLATVPDERERVAHVYADQWAWVYADGIWYQESSDRWMWGYGVMMGWLHTDTPGIAMVEQVYRSHLRRMIELSEQAGCHVILMTYPRDDLQFPNEIVREFDRVYESATLVDLEPFFKRVLETEDRETLFIPDGHCTSAGYRLVAEEIVPVLDKLR